jgi:hypothetical protein
MGNLPSPCILVVGVHGGPPRVHSRDRGVDLGYHIGVCSGEVVVAGHEDPMLVSEVLDESMEKVRVLGVPELELR